MSLSLRKLLSKDTEKKSTEPSILEKNWGTLVSLIGIFVLALSIRSLFAFDLATKFGSPFLLSGGSDAYYYNRIIDFIHTNKYHLMHDPLRKYPLEAGNPRPPLFAWSVVLGGYLITPLVGDATTAISYAFILSTGVWGALTVFPTYLIGRDVFGKKSGIAAAFLLAISSGHLQRSVITNGDHDAMYLFFAVAGFYFFMKALQRVPVDREWVSDWSEKTEIKEGILTFLSKNKKTLLYAGMAGMAIGTVALTWKGYAYLVVIILVYFFFQLLVNKFRKKDSLGVTACLGVTLGLAFLIAAPYYYTAGFGAALPYKIGKWFDMPMVLSLAAFGLGVYFSVTRDIPWLLVIGALAGVGVTFFAIGNFYFPGFVEMIASGGGYFIQNKLYSTIAEAQAPQFSNLVLSFGMVSFFISIIGLGLMIYHLRKSWDLSFIFILIWSAFAIYMATSAARFIFNSSPAFALTAGWVLAIIADKTDFSEIAKVFRSYRGDVLRGIYEGVKIKHILVTLMVVFLIMVPNTLYAFDSGMPYDEKEKYNDEIHKDLPETLKAPEYNASSGNLWYLGAFGYSMDKPSGYWPAAWDWLSNQDKDLPPGERPAFLSWWDYGFEAMRRGDHPTVADNFQQGYRLAGNVLMSQNESEILALIITRQLELPIREEGEFKGDLKDILTDHLGDSKTRKLEEIMTEYPENYEKYKKKVLSNPDRYHPRAEDIQAKNVEYAMTMGLLSYEDKKNLGELYRDISLEIDKRIKYFAVDSRLFPFSGRNTGIFYAPAKLSGHRIDESGGMRTPKDFFEIKLVDIQGNEYDSPEEVPEEAQLRQNPYQIKYKPMFYQSTLYKIFIGYNAREAGESEGIPGVNNRQLPPMPGWNMTFFKTSYRTAYYNPYPRDKARNKTDAWRATSYEEAKRLQEKENGSADLRALNSMGQRVVFLEYYDGAVVEGKVTTEDGQPIPGAQVTVLQPSKTANPRYMTPHDVVKTDEDGEYRALAPEGDNIRLAVSTGSSGEQRNQQLFNIRSIALGSTTFNVSEEQAMRKKVDRDLDGKYDYKIHNDFEVGAGSIEGNVYIDNDGDGKYTPTNDTLSPARVIAENTQNDIKRTLETDNGTFNFENIVPGNYTLKTNVKGTSQVQDISVERNKTVSKDISVPTGNLTVNAERADYSISIENIELSLEHTATQEVITRALGEGFKNIIPGTYLLSVNSSTLSLMEGSKKVIIGQNERKTENVTITASETISGETLPEQKLTFTRTSRSNFSKTISSDESGEFEIKVPQGRFRIYGHKRMNDENYVHMSVFSTENKEEIQVTFEKAYQLSGQVDYENIPQQDFKLLFKHVGSEDEVLVPTNPEGKFSIDLKRGEYRLYGWKRGNLQNLLTWKKFSINSDKSIDIYPVLGKEISGTIYRDENLNNMYDDNEGIQTGINILKDDKKIAEISSGIEGKYRAVLPNDKCNIIVQKDGFKDHTLSYDPQDDNEELSQIALTPEIIDVKGSISYQGYRPQSFNITFNPEYGEPIQRKFSGDTYNVELNPATYDVLVEDEFENGAKKITFKDKWTIEPGTTELDKTLDTVTKTKLNGKTTDSQGFEVPAKIFFQKDSSKETITTTHSVDNGSYEIYLKADTYSIRAVNDTKGITQQYSIELSEAKQHDIILTDDIKIDTEIKHTDLKKKDMITVNFENLQTGFNVEKKTDVNGKVSANLISGEYNITVDQIINETVMGTTQPIERKVRYYYSEISSASAIKSSLELNRDIMNGTLSGQAFIEKPDGQKQYLEGIELDYTPAAHHPLSIATNTVTSNDGHYEVPLSRGMYRIYSTPTIGGKEYALLQNFLMGEENETLSLQLKPATTLEGKVMKDGKGVQTNLSISNPNVTKPITTDENGYYQTVLPQGSYSIEGRIEEDGNTYEEEKEIELKYEYRQEDIKLEKQLEYGIDGSVGNNEKRLASGGDEITYHITLENTGNTKDEFELSSQRWVWDINFDHSKFKIRAGETRDIEVTVKAPDDATVSHPPIGFKVSSLNSEKTFTASTSSEDNPDLDLPDIEVKQIYGVQILPGMGETMLQNGFLNYTITVRNSGNGEDVYNLKILNKREIQRAGWKVNIKNTTGKLSGEADNRVTISLKGQRGDLKEEVNVKVTAISQGDPSVYDIEEFQVYSPNVQVDKDSFDLQGEKLTLEKETFNLKTWHWAVIVILAVTAAIYVIKKERWI